MLPTLKEYGKQLPIGFTAVDGKLHRDFTLKEWDWETEEQISDAVSAHKVQGFGTYVSEVVGHSLDQLGDIPFGQMQPNDRRVLVSQMYYSDVLTIYTWIRIGAYGPHLKLEPFQCGNPMCRQEIQFTGDLETLEIQPLEGELGREVELQHGVVFAKERRHKVKVMPLRWNMFESPEFVMAMTNAAKFKRLTIQNGVQGVEGVEGGGVYFTREHLKSMRPIDITKLMRAIDECGGGVVMQIRDKCPHCGSEFQEDIDWRYGDFFGRSVL